MGTLTDWGTGQIHFGVFGSNGGTVALETSVDLANPSFTGNYTINCGSSGAAISLAGNGDVAVSAGKTVTLNAPLGGTDQLVTTEGGILTLSASNTYTGGTNVGGGTLTLTNTSGSGTGTGGVTVSSGGTLNGTGNASGAVNVSSGGILSAGIAGPGVLDVGSVTLASGSTFDAVVNSSTAYSELNVAGAVTINNAQLNLTGSAVPSAGSQIVLINNEGGGSVSGTFANLPQGSETTLNGVTYAISYHGGESGNDVVLTAVPQTLVVNNSADTSTTTNGTLTLREAIAEVNAAGGNHTITFASSVSSIILGGSPLMVADSTGTLTIDGPGASLLSINADDHSGVFSIASGSTTEIENLTITSGNSSAGGGIYDNGALTLNNCTISGNSATGNGGGLYNNNRSLTVTDTTFNSNTAAGGGACYNNAGEGSNGNTTTFTDCSFSNNSAVGNTGGAIASEAPLTITDCAFETNSAEGYGGAIENVAQTTISESTFAHNSANEGGALSNAYIAIISDSAFEDNQATDGGAIVNGIGEGVTMTDSTISGNTATFGGGIYNRGYLTAIGSTVNNNTASQEGGGFYTGAYSNAAVTVTNSTISNNIANGGGGDGGGVDGGVGPMTITDSTISLNSGGGVSGGDSVVINGSIIADNGGTDLAGYATAVGSYNLIGDGSGGLSASPASHNILGSASSKISPMLVALGDYGGSTETMPLLPGSPALGAGSNFDEPSNTPITTDQRGVFRGSASDIGAFQSQGFVVSTTGGSGTQSATVGTAFAPLAIHVTSNDSGFTDLSGGIITFTAPSSGATASLGSQTVTLNSSNLGSDPATANSVVGTYTVTASASPGTGTAAVFSLTNLAPYSITISGAASAVAGSPYSLYLSGPPTLTGWTINWGDGTADPDIQSVPGSPAYVTHTFSAGTYSITASATDASGATYLASGGSPVTITVTGGSPLRIIGSGEGELNLPVSLQATGGNVSNGTSSIAYIWSVIQSGSATPIATGEGAIFSFIPTAPGSYTASVTAIGDPAGPFVANFAVNVPPPVAPALTIDAPPDLEVGHLGGFSMDEQQVWNYFGTQQEALWEEWQSDETPHSPTPPTFQWSAEWVSANGTVNTFYYPHGASTSAPVQGQFFIEPYQYSPIPIVAPSRSFEFDAPEVGTYTITLDINYGSATVLAGSVSIVAVPATSIGTLNTYLPIAGPTETDEYGNFVANTDALYGSDAIELPNGNIIVATSPASAIQNPDYEGADVPQVPWVLTELQPDLSLNTGFQDNGYFEQPMPPGPSNTIAGPGAATLIEAPDFGQLYVPTNPEIGGVHIALCANGDFIVASEADIYDYPFPLTVWMMARYHSDGDLDTSFGTNGFAIDYDGWYLGHLQTMAVEDNGDILLGGGGYVPDTAESWSLTGPGVTDNTYGYHPTDGTLRQCFLVERWNADGKSLDSSFGDSSLESSQAAVEDASFASNEGDGREFVEVDPDADFYQQWDGSLNGEPSELTILGAEMATALAIQPGTGDIIVGGFTSTDYLTPNDSVNNVPIALIPDPVKAPSSPGNIGGLAMIRLTPDGQLDTSFGPSTTGAYTAGRIITIVPNFDESYLDNLGFEPNGDIIAMGSAGVYTSVYDGQEAVSDGLGDSPSDDLLAARYTPDGVREATGFGDSGDDGFALENFYNGQIAYSGAVTASGEILLAGQALDGGLLAVLTLDGTANFHAIIDGTQAEFAATGFSDGQAPVDEYNKILLLRNNDVLLVGGGDNVGAVAPYSDEGGSNIGGGYNSMTNVFGWDYPTGINYGPQVSVARYNLNTPQVGTLIATATPSGPINLSWVNLGEGQDGFEITRATTPDGLGDGDATVIYVGPDQTSYTDGNVTPNTTYYYQVGAFDTSSTGQEQLTGQSNIADATTAPIDAGYVLQDTIHVPDDGSVVDSDISLVAGQPYLITVTGFLEIDNNPNGTGYKMADAAYGQFIPDPEEFSVLGTVIRYGVGINDTALSMSNYPDWGPPSTDQNHTYSIIYTPNAADEPGTPGGPGVLAFNFHDNYYPDNQLGAYFTVTIYRALPSSPSNVVAVSDRAANEINLSWQNNSTDATAIIVERAGANGVYQQIAELPPTATSYSDPTFGDTPVSYNTPYTYQVYAVDQFGQSAASNTAYATLVNLPPVIQAVPRLVAYLDSEFDYTIEATDPQDGKAGLAYSPVSIPNGATLNSTTGEITWTPTSWSGGSSFTVQVTDAEGTSSTVSFVVLQAPALSSLPQVVPPTVVSQTATTVTLSEAGGDANTTYQWVVASQPLQAGIPSFSVNSSASAAQTTATLSGAGAYTFEVILTNSSAWPASSSVSVTVSPILSSISVTPPLTAAPPGLTAALSAKALDQFGQPLAAQPTFNWSVAGGTAGGSISSSGVYTAPSSASTTENTVINASVTGSSVIGVADVTVPGPGDAGPSIVPGHDADANPLSFTQLQLSVLATDSLEPESDLTYTWSWSWIGPAPAPTVAPAFNENGTNAAKNAIVTIAPGLIDYEFDVIVTDQQGLTATSNIELTDERNFSSLTLTPNKSEILTDQSIPFTASALDQYMQSLSPQPTFNWSLNGAAVAGVSGANYTFDAPDSAGNYTVMVTATVGATTYSATDNFSVIAPGPDTLFISSPGAGYGQPAAVISQDTPVDIVADNLDGTQVPWSLVLIGPTGASTTLASSSSSVGQAPDSPGLAATIDAESLPNGPYTLELEDGSNNVVDSKYLDIETQLKLGNLTLPFTDLTINIPGAEPLPITRTYDSSQASNNTEHLGYGWSLNVTQSPITSTVSPQLDSTQYPGYTDGDLLYLTTPDGTQYTFEFLPQPTGDFEDNPLGGLLASVETYYPQFVCVDGSGAKLNLMSGGDPIGTDLTLVQSEGRYVDNSNTGAFFNPANPLFDITYNLVATNDTTYTFNPNTDQLESATDANHNVTQYSSSQPYGIVDVPAGSNGAGDIQSITDTATGQEVQYGYDSAGNLVTVTDPSGHVTTYSYNASHQLIGIVDSNNVTVLTATYDPTTSLLASLVNALHQSSGVNTGGFDGTTADQTTTDAAGNTTEDIYDQYGDVTREIQTITSSGNITGYMVTVSSYSYFNTQNIDAASTGVDLLNTPMSQVTYAPFEVYGTDSVGSRYTEEPPTPPQQIITYFQWSGDDSSLTNPDLGRPESEMTLAGPASVSGEYLYNVTEFPEFLPDSSTPNYNQFGQPQSTQTYIATTDANGNVLTSGGNPVEQLVSSTSSQYDAAGNLASSTDATGVTTSHLYTTAGYGVRAGQVYETLQQSPGDSSPVEISYNYYYGDGLDGSQPEYIIAPPPGLSSTASEWQIGLLAGTRSYNYENQNGSPATLKQTTYYVYDAQGNTVLTETYKGWANDTVYGWVASGTNYNIAGQSIGSWQATYYDGTIDNPHPMSVQVTSATEATSTAAATPDSVVVNETLYNGVAILSTGATTYTSDGQTLTTTDQYGEVTSNTYDASGHLVQTLSPDGTGVRTAYDALGRVIWQTDRSTVAELNSGANATETVYNSLGEVSATYRMSGVVITLSADPNAPSGSGLEESALENPTDSGTQISESQTVYNTQGEAAETISPSGLMSGTVYNADGSVLNSGTVVFAATAPSGSLPFPDAVDVPTGEGAYLIDYTTNAYDQTTSLPSSATSVGAVSYGSVTDALNHITETFVNAAGQTVEVLYADGSFTQTIYSTGDQPLSAYTYNTASGAVVPAIPAGGSETVTIAQHKSTDTSVPYTIDIYDAAGNLVDVYEPPVADALSDGVKISPHTHYDYDASGDEIDQIDANGEASTNPSSGETFFTYDPNGSELSRTLPGGETETYTYNIYGQVATHTDFDGNTATYTYYTTYGSGAYTGSVEQIVYTPGSGAAPGTTWQTVSYTYDSLGRQKTVTDASGPTTDSYDGQGNLDEQQTPEGTISYNFNQATGELISTSTAYTSISYGYNAQGELTSVTETKLDGNPVDLVTTYTYDPAGNKQTETLPDGEITNYLYDDLNRLTQMTETLSGTTLFSETFTLDDAGDRTSAVETQVQPDNGGTITDSYSWGYDADGRLLTESLSATGTGAASSTAPNENYSDTYTYDLDGNQITDQHTGNTENGAATDGTTTYTYDGDDQLTSSLENGITTSYTYDANGSETKVTTGSTVTATYTYDVRNKMVTYSNGGSTSATYVYDDAGNRVAETNTSGGTSVTTFYLTDTQNPTGYAQPIEEHQTTLSSTPTQTYLIGDHVFGQVASNSAVSYLLIDGHGSTQQITSSSGTVTAALAYTAYGSALNFNPASIGTAYLFGGDAIYDKISGLYMHGDGTRDANGFRFIQADTQGNGDNSNPISLHQYLYAGGNPISNVDPSGHDFGLAELGIANTIQNLIASAYAGAFGGALIAARAVARGESVWQAEADFLIAQAEGLVFGYVYFYAFDAVDALVGLAGDSGTAAGSTAIGIEESASAEDLADDPAEPGLAGVTDTEPVGTIPTTTGATGEFGETAATNFLQRRGYTDLVAIQNNSGHGIDIVGRNPSGQLEFFEVKTSLGPDAPPLSEAQSDPQTFVTSRLERAANGTARGWKSVDPNVQQNAQDIIDEMRATGQPIKGSVIEVTNVGTGTADINVRDWTSNG